MRMLIPGAFVTIVFAAFTLSSSRAAGGAVTFNKDVAPIIFKNCMVCHRAGEIGPMPLTNYKEARPWAKSIREAVLARAMPPWGADPRHGAFSDDRSLSQKEIDTLVAWVDGGAKEGDPKDLPPAPKFVDGWGIGKPDVVFSAPEEYSIPADGVLPYKNYAIPTNFTEDKYAQLAEVRPSNRGVVHHAVVYIQDKEGRWLENWVVGYSPGATPKSYRPGRVKLIPKGATLILNMHYTPNGTASKDRTSVGFVFAKGPVEKHVYTAISGTRNIDIPPGDPNFEIKAAYTFKEDSHIESLKPHMHARGKDMLYTLVYPDGKSQVLLFVPRFNFNWQMGYTFKESFAAPKGSRLEVVAHYDNSARNKYNPDPTARAHYGEQTWDEMLAGYFEYTLDNQNLQEAAQARAAALK